MRNNLDSCLGFHEAFSMFLLFSKGGKRLCTKRIFQILKYCVIDKIAIKYGDITVYL